MSSVLRVSDFCEISFGANTRVCSQVHDIHPSHAFLLVPEKPSYEHEYSPVLPGMIDDNSEEQCEYFR